MHKKVAVEQDLNNVKQYFHDQGYQVDLFSDTELDSIWKVSEYDAIIISGGNKHFMGIQDAETKVPIIDMEGMSPEEVFNRVERLQSEIQG